MFYNIIAVVRYYIVISIKAMVMARLAMFRVAFMDMARFVKLRVAFMDMAFIIEAMVIARLAFMAVAFIMIVISFLVNSLNEQELGAT